MEGAVYILCAATALACAALLLRGYLRTGTRLLLWCGLFFLAATVENVILFTDLIIFRDDLSLLSLRRTLGLAGVAILVYGLVWEVR